MDNFDPWELTDDQLDTLQSRLDDRKEEKIQEEEERAREYSKQLEREKEEAKSYYRNRWYNMTPEQKQAERIKQKNKY